MADGKWVRYRNRIDALLGILPGDVGRFDHKVHSRTRPEAKRAARKRARAARRGNR